MRGVYNAHQKRCRQRSSCPIPPSFTLMGSIVAINVVSGLKFAMQLSPQMYCGVRGSKENGTRSRV